MEARIVAAGEEEHTARAHIAKEVGRNVTAECIAKEEDCTAMEAGHIVTMEQIVPVKMGITSAVKEQAPPIYHSSRSHMENHQHVFTRFKNLQS